MSIQKFKIRAYLILMLYVISGSVYALEDDIEDNNECATCHVMWLSDFQNPDVVTLIPYRGTPLEKSGREADVASNERMCFTCHDGYVLESRFRWRRGTFNHPVGGKVPDKVKIPNVEGKETFPLNLDKRVYCGTCHSAHGVDWNQNSSAIFMRAINKSSNMCRACHSEHATGTQEGNHPILDRIQKFPQELIEAGAKVGPGEKMVCESCHRQHGAPDKKLLVIKNGASSRLCRTCHREKRTMVNTKHDLSVMKPNAKNVKGQTVRKSGLCSACHVPHGAQGPALASQKVKPGTNPVLGSCLACHRKNGIAKKKAIGFKHSHPVNVSVNDVGISIKDKKWLSSKANKNAPRELTALPLFDVQGNRSDSATKMSCGTCHDPHNWSPDITEFSEISTEDPRKYSGDGSNSFLRIKQEKNSNLCINCHVDKAAVIATRHNPAVFKDEQAKLMSSSGKLELESGICGTCHTAHNGTGAAMWARKIGAGQAAIERLCNECHQSSGAAEEKLTGRYSHPVGKKLTNGSVMGNMLRFNKKGKRVKKAGYIDCSTCHDPHQWDPTNINSKEGTNLDIDGNVNNSFLRLRADSKAGMCLKCHKNEALVAGTDHDLSITAPNARNSLGQDVSESGLCGTCHAVHNSKSEKGLWGRELGPGDDTSAQVCFSCHAKGGIAGSKVMPNKLTTHPRDIVVWSGDIRKAAGLSKEQGVPVFDDKGDRSKVGYITCASCHNPHLWAAKKKAKGPGKNVEGDSSSSFLNLKTVANNVCADCHGLDALFRYKYFHSKSSRKEHPLFTK